MTVRDLGGLWQSIEQSGSFAQSSIRFMDTGVSFARGNALVGVDGLNRRHLCIPVDIGEAGRADTRSRGVTLEVRELLNPQGATALFLDVHCRKPELNHLFQTVATEILLECVKGVRGMFAAAQSVLERWRDLLEPDNTTILGERQLAALLSELLLLERLGKGVPPVHCWLGPERGPHDFICGGKDFEVKSTLSPTRLEVHVNGLMQLTAVPDSELYLWLVRLRRAPGRGVTVPATVARLIERGADKLVLFNKLKREGYLLGDESSYRVISFEILASHLYRVDDKFPRLTNASFAGGLAPQIVEVDYVINLNSGSPAPMQPFDADKLLESVEAVA